VKVTDELFNNLVINPSIDSIQEFKIQESQYPAEFDGKASALISVATRAGTNAFHGSLFEFLRQDLFDAPNYFDPRNRRFFFVSGEGQRVRRSLTRTFSVPSEAVRRGEQRRVRVVRVRHRDLFEHGAQDALLPGEWLTLEATALELGVRNTVIKRLIAEGVLPATHVVDYAPWVITRTDLQRPAVQARIQAVHQGHKLPRPVAGQDQLPWKSDRL
jgi:hypothetical protein